MKRIFLVILVFLCHFGFSQNFYELPYNGTVSKLTKLNKEETKTFLSENKIPESYSPRNSNLDEGTFLNDQYCGKADLVAVYREEITDENGSCLLSVYRCMYYLNNKTKISLKRNGKNSVARKNMGQVIYIKDHDILYEYYRAVYFGNEPFYGSNGYGAAAENIQFRINNGFLYSFFTKIAYDGDNYWSENRVFSNKLNEIFNKTEIASIEASFPLIDDNNPFKYTFQNAMDGDPSTSYVEDTENDLFEINIDFMNYDTKLKQDTPYEIKIINGYAKNFELYMNNNRIKNLEHDIDEADTPICFSCSDKELDFQEIEISNPTTGWLWLEVLDFYPGKKYSDTCLSELNIKFKNEGWLFKE